MPVDLSLHSSASSQSGVLHSNLQIWAKKTKNVLKNGWWIQTLEVFYRKIGASHWYTSPCTKVKVMCKGQGQISGSCFSKDGCFGRISVSQIHLVFFLPLQCFHFKPIAESFHRLKSHLTRLFFQKYKKNQAFYLHPDIICLTNCTVVPGLINGNLLTDRVLDIVWSFHQSNVPIDTDYHILALRIIISHLCSWLRKVDHHHMVFSSHDRNIRHTSGDGNHHIPRL